MTSKKNIKKAVNLLLKGEVVILPTDTVYGLFGRAFDKNAGKKIYRIKGRDFVKPLQVFLSKKSDIFKYCQVNEKQKKYIDKYLPGPYTLILKLKKNQKKLFCFLKDTIGIRIIKNKLLNEIIKKTGPLAASSANFSGQPTPVKFKDINKNIVKKVFFIKNDKFVKGKSSTVIDITGEEIKIIRK